LLVNCHFLERDKGFAICALSFWVEAKCATVEHQSRLLNFSELARVTSFMSGDQIHQ